MFLWLGSLLDKEILQHLDILPVQSTYPLSFSRISTSPNVELVLYETLIPYDIEAPVEITCLVVRDRAYVHLNGL